MDCMNAAKRHAKKVKKRQELEEANKAFGNSLNSDQSLYFFQETPGHNVNTLKGDGNHSQIGDPKDFMNKLMTYVPYPS
ncbi:hypothetical protein BHYA_0162g00040 [Botrytis hyacinthi]|uniref:Uncharacterized protein n=1 Tax=Botrytis hyacinthi TaxID=278943 RepID=A0A4Z1GEF9_9HELO|nr:hypothetical protein BHYA_0162g00040 [Botrytis hyacinthi]